MQITDIISYRDYETKLKEKYPLIRSGIITLLMYFLIGRMIDLIQYACEILVCSTILLKIVFHVISDDSDLKQHLETTMNADHNIKELKMINKKTKQIKRVRYEYTGTLLKQILAIIIIRIMIMFLPFLAIVPFIGSFSNIIHLFLLILMLMTQIPLPFINLIISLIARKLNIPTQNCYMMYSMSDIIISWIKRFINESKLSSIRTARDIILKYENDKKIELYDNDYNCMLNTFNNLGINSNCFNDLKNKINFSINWLISMSLSAHTFQLPPKQ